MLSFNGLAKKKIGGFLNSYRHKIFRTVKGKRHSRVVEEDGMFTGASIIVKQRYGGATCSLRKGIHKSLPNSLGNFVSSQQSKDVTTTPRTFRATTQADTC